MAYRYRVTVGERIVEQDQRGAYLTPVTAPALARREGRRESAGTVVRVERFRAHRWQARHTDVALGPWQRWREFRC